MGPYSEESDLSSLKEKLKALEELQQIDLELNEIQAAIAAHPARREQVEAAVVAARKAWE